MRLVPRWAALAFAMAIAACARPAGTDSGVLPGQPSCRARMVPSELPTLVALFDAPALRRDLSAATFTATAREYLVSVVIAEAGRPSAIAFQDTTAPREVVSAVRTSILTHMRPQPPGEIWGVRVLIAAGPSPTVELRQAALCPPQLRLESLNSFRQSRYGISRAQARNLLRRQSTLRVALAIDHDGNVTDVSILRGLGGRSSEEIAEEEIRLWKFRPLTVDGIPVSTTLRIDDIDLIGLIGRQG